MTAHRAVGFIAPSSVDEIEATYLAGRALVAAD
jgi:hypothetical protein